MAPPALAADGITRGTIYQDGPDNRYLLGGSWLFRRDDAGVGIGQRFQRQTATEGWSAVTAPNAWNVGDDSVASMTGTVAWYRKDFTLPDRRARMDWLVRFESVNYRSRVWLNGVPVGANTGAYLPWDVRLPRSALKRSGTNRLVVRVDNRRLPTDFPPVGPDGLRRSRRRVVELRRPAARGLSAARRPDRHHEPRRAARAAVPDLRRDRARARRRAQLRRPDGERPRHRPLRRARDRARHAARAGEAVCELRDPPARRPAAAVVAGEPVSLRGALRRARRRAARARLQAVERHPLDHDRRRPPDAQRPPREPARRRPARGRPAQRGSRSTALAARRSSRRPRSSARR